LPDLSGSVNFSAAFVESSLKDRLLEPILLRHAEKIAESTNAEKREQIAPLHRAAKSRIDATRELRGEGENAAAISLQRQAFALAVTAALASKGDLDGKTPLTTSEAWARLGELGEAPSAERASLETLMKDDDPLAGDRLDPKQADEARIALDAVIAWAMSKVEPRTVRAIKAQRVIRTIGLSLGFIVLLTAAVVWAVSYPNVARGKPVRASSRYPNSPEPAGATDGIRGNGFGVHTNVEERPWVEIDLGAVYLIRRIEVFHRSDGYQEESLPMTLEISEDRSRWTEIGTRAQAFTAKDPWKSVVDRQRAQFVRVSVRRKTYLSLSEIEVYGSKP